MTATAQWAAAATGWAARCLDRSTTAMLAALLAIALAVPALAQETDAPDAAPDPDAVVATIDGEPVTEADIALAREDFAAALQRYPQENHREILIDLVVNLQLMARAADADGLASTEEFKRRYDFARSRLLRDMYFTKQVEQSITEEDLRAAYDKAVGEPQQEVHARHILVETEAEAESVLKTLEGGADFAELAKEKSIDPSAVQNGGDLGYFIAGEMIPAFSAAAFAMEPGTLSQPVETQHGWHVIKVEDKRPRQPPAFDDVKEQVRQLLVRDRFAELLEKLKQEADVTIVGQEAGAAADGDEADDGAQP